MKLTRVGGALGELKKHVDGLDGSDAQNPSGGGPPQDNDDDGSTKNILQEMQRKTAQQKAEDIMRMQNKEKEVFDDPQADQNLQHKMAKGRKHPKVYDVGDRPASEDEKVLLLQADLYQAEAEVLTIKRVEEVQRQELEAKDIELKAEQDRCHNLCTLNDQCVKKIASLEDLIKSRDKAGAPLLNSSPDFCEDCGIREDEYNQDLARYQEKVATLEEELRMKREMLKENSIESERMKFDLGALKEQITDQLALTSRYSKETSDVTKEMQSAKRLLSLAEQDIMGLKEQLSKVRTPSKEEKEKTQTESGTTKCTEDTDKVETLLKQNRKLYEHIAKLDGELNHSNSKITELMTGAKVREYMDTTQGLNPLEIDSLLLWVVKYRAGKHVVNQDCKTLLIDHLNNLAQI